MDTQPHCHHGTSTKRVDDLSALNGRKKVTFEGFPPSMFPVQEKNENDGAQLYFNSDVSLCMPLCIVLNVQPIPLLATAEMNKLTGGLKGRIEKKRSDVSLPQGFCTKI
jgi:hypothetical protein